MEFGLHQGYTNFPEI